MSVMAKRGHRDVQVVRRDIDSGKAVEVLLYVTAKVSNMYNALKVIYFADRYHLEKYGRLIYGDRYIAMQYGPVPSLAYDIVKGAEGYPGKTIKLPGSEFFAWRNNHISAQRKADTDALSESDIECLNEAIRTYGRKTFESIKKESHKDTAFRAADANGLISTEDIAKSLPSSNKLLKHICSV